MGGGLHVSAAVRPRPSAGDVLAEARGASRVPSAHGTRDAHPTLPSRTPESQVRASGRLGDRESQPRGLARRSRSPVTLPASV